MTAALRPLHVAMLVGVLLLSVVVGLSFGAMAVPVRSLVQSVWSYDASDAGQLVVRNLRMPRVLLGAVVGMALGTAGALMQGLFRNPLASPSLVGSTTGASLGAAIAIVLGAALPGSLAIGAVMGSVVATLVVLGLGSATGERDTATLLLAGIAVNAICGSGTGLMVFLADDAQLRTFTFFTLGSLGGGSWSQLAWVMPVLLIPVMIAGRFSRSLDALLLGEVEARHLGVDVRRLQALLVCLVGVGVGVSVAVSGVIGFVGLVVPHLARMVWGPHHAVVLPASAVGGAVLLVLADTAARTVVAPAELPIGILTTLVGGPFFLFLLMRSRGTA